MSLGSPWIHVWAPPDAFSPSQAYYTMLKWWSTDRRTGDLHTINKGVTITDNTLVSLLALSSLHTTTHTRAHTQHSCGDHQDKVARLKHFCSEAPVLLTQL